MAVGELGTDDGGVDLSHMSATSAFVLAQANVSLRWRDSRVSNTGGTLAREAC